MTVLHKGVIVSKWFPGFNVQFFLKDARGACNFKICLHDIRVIVNLCCIVFGWVVGGGEVF